MTMDVNLELPPVLNGNIKIFDFGRADNAPAWMDCILCELDKDIGIDFWSRHLLLDAWRDNRMFGLCMEETTELFHLDRPHGPPSISSPPNKACGYFMYTSITGSCDYVFPCFLVKSHDHSTTGERIDEEVDFIWVAPRVRNVGFDYESFHTAFSK